MTLLATYIAVPWLVSCSPQGWVDYFRGNMTLAEATGSLSVRHCVVLAPKVTWTGDGPKERTICVKNDSDVTGYVAVRESQDGPRVEMGPNVHACERPTS